MANSSSPYVDTMTLKIPIWGHRAIEEPLSNDMKVVVNLLWDPPEEQVKDMTQKQLNRALKRSLIPFLIKFGDVIEEMQKENGVYTPPKYQAAD